MWKPKGKQGIPGYSFMLSLGMRGRTRGGGRFLLPTTAAGTASHCLAERTGNLNLSQFRYPGPQDQLPFAGRI